MHEMESSVPPQEQVVTRFAIELQRCKLLTAEMSDGTEKGRDGKSLLHVGETRLPVGHSLLLGCMYFMHARASVSTQVQPSDHRSGQFLKVIVRMCNNAQIYLDIIAVMSRIQSFLPELSAANAALPADAPPIDVPMQVSDDTDGSDEEDEEPHSIDQAVELV